MENVDLNVFSDVYRGRRVVVTGHTGFKGSWLTLWLTELGAHVTGISLDPVSTPNHWDLLRLDACDRRQNIGDAAKVLELVQAARPEIVFHLAAQALVRRSYSSPVETWSANVMGTAHVLEACRHVDSVRAIVAVTTDKVYMNMEWSWGYRETDRLGGHDPYSASKAATEILVESYRKAFFDGSRQIALASARSGNVIGGGDWSEDRLIPDLVKSISAKRPLVIRSARATRPWQHVLECLAGYLVLGEKLLAVGAQYAEPWNFGPGSEDNRTVAEILHGLHAHWPDLAWKETAEQQPHESTLLYLDNAKARARLGWRPVWPLERALQATAEWYQFFYGRGDVASRAQLTAYTDDARKMKLSWAQP